jgi:TIR domain
MSSPDVPQSDPRKASGQAYDIFISHSSRRSADDHELVDALAGILRRHGLTVFLDRLVLRPGMRLISSLERALTQSSVGVVILTQRAIESGWVALELEVMEQQRVTGSMRVVGLRLDADCPLPWRIAPENVIDPPNRHDVSYMANRLLSIVRSSSRRRCD